jgi:O-acetylserine/cysteine efflux transporter
MPIYHFLLIIMVVAIWGCNFIFIKFSLNEISPLFLCSIRFLLASIPAIYFIKPPAAPFKLIALYGLFMFGLQFALMFMGMHVGMTPGLASLLVQIQIFFSIFFAAVFLREIPNLWQIGGALVSFAGICLVAMHFDKNVSLVGFLLIIAAAAAWGIGNLITKKINHVNMIGLVVWGSLVACLPLLLSSLLFEGPQRIVYSFHHVSWLGFISVLYIVYASTWIGYGAWNWLLSHYSIATVAPFTLLVPIFGILSSALILGEPLQRWKLIAGLLVITGLCINLLGTRYYKHLNRKRSSTQSI